MRDDESRGTVPKKMWKHIGGIAPSQLFISLRVQIV